MKLYLKEDVYFVCGYKNAAIYDTINKKVYAINSYGKEILTKLLKDNEIKKKVEIDFIDTLKKLDLLTNKKTRKCIIEEPKTKLNYAWLEITEACNLRCVHCYGQFGYPQIDKNKTLTFEEWKNIIDELLKIGCTDIQLIGGEPMMSNDFFKILKYAHDKGMNRIDVFTNGTLITSENIKILKDTNATVRISLYGHNAEIHEKITKQKGSFNKTERALILLKKYNIPTTIAVVLMRENENFIDDIRKYIESLNYQFNGYDVIRPSCKMDKELHSITKPGLLKNRYNIRPEFRTTKKSYIENIFYNSCWNKKIAITSSGDLLPCIFARDEVIGNIKKSSKDILKEKVIEKWKITKDKVETCKDCEFRYCCHDCRPLAKAINGNIYSKYPRCCYNPYTGEWGKIEECGKEELL